MADKTNLFRIERFAVTKLWNEPDRNYSIRFDPHVSIIVGPNGSGKTTVLNLIHHILSVDIHALSQIAFEEGTLHLRSFHGEATRTIAVSRGGGEITFRIGKRTIAFADEPTEVSVAQARRARIRYGREAADLKEQVRKLVPTVWLPVTRRLPIPDEEDERYYVRRQARMESVDQRLFDLLRELSAYRVRLDAQMAQRYKEFERGVLEAILYSKEDSPTDFGPEPTDQEKEQLIRAFRDAGLLNRRMSDRIEEHFTAAREALGRIRQKPDKLNWEDISILPLISRTKTMVRAATALEDQRLRIFASLRVYEGLVNNFLNDKSVAVQEDGTLQMFRKDNRDRQFTAAQLSSGEKQIVILLTEALLQEGRPVVYVADEPELSLHIEWQEQLLEAIVALAKEVQIIVATHSPDIVGPFNENVIELLRVQ